MIKHAFKFLRKNGINSLNFIPPVHSLIGKEKLNAFFFTMDDISEKSNLLNLKRLSDLLDKYGIRGTFFVIPSFKHNLLSAKKAGAIKQILKKHEFAQHGIWHDKTEEKLGENHFSIMLTEGKKLLEEKLKTKIYGYRSPYFSRRRFLPKILSKEGFIYNSDQFLFRPYPFIKDNLVVIPCHDKCDPFSIELCDKSILDLVTSKIEYSIKSGKPYVFLMHAQDINEKNLAILDKIFAEAKSQDFIVDLSLSDISTSLFKKTI